jgi:DoxX-like family
MQSTIEPRSKKVLWTGRAITALVVLFMLFDSITKLMRVGAVVKACEQFGYPVSLISVIGIILLACVVIYIIPRTSVLGALLLTGYLGGAVEANLRVGHPLFSETLFPVYFAVLIWAGLLLREQRLREFLSLKKTH